MYRRIIVVAFLLLSFMCLSVNGQTAIVYSYDSAGNRTSRTTVEATNVASVSSEMSIDANDQLKSSFPVSKDFGNIASLAFGEVEEKAGTSCDKGDSAGNTSLMWRPGFLKNKRSMNEYTCGIGKYSYHLMAIIDVRVLRSGSYMNKICEL